MLSFLLVDGSGQVIGANDVSHASFLPEAPADHYWIEVPSPAADWSVEPAPAGGYSIVPRPRSLAELKAEKIAAVEAVLAARFAAGFLVSGTGTAMDGERLQVRDAIDRTNWLTSKDTYKSAVEAGYGDQPGAFFRTASNATFTLTFAQGLAVIDAMGPWGFALMQASWAYKDQIAAAEDLEALDLIDVEAGWP